jgi:hypothetical protein
LLGGKGKVVNGGVGLLSCVGTEVYRERRGGGETNKYTARVQTNSMTGLNDKQRCATA